MIDSVATSVYSPIMDQHAPTPTHANGATMTAQGPETPTLTEAQARGVCLTCDKPGATPYATDTTVRVPYCARCKAEHEAAQLAASKKANKEAG